MDARKFNERILSKYQYKAALLGNNFLLFFCWLISLKKCEGVAKGMLFTLTIFSIVNTIYLWSIDRIYQDDWI